jgi:hypothetical protein
MLFSSQGSVGLIGACDNLLKMDSDFSGRASDLREEIMWLEIATELLDFNSN